MRDPRGLEARTDGVRVADQAVAEGPSGADLETESPPKCGGYPGVGESRGDSLGRNRLEWDETLSTKCINRLLKLSEFPITEIE